jgi:hypothetical protein
MPKSLAHAENHDYWADVCKTKEKNAVVGDVYNMYETENES